MQPDDLEISLTQKIHDVEVSLTREIGGLERRLMNETGGLREGLAELRGELRIIKAMSFAAVGVLIAIAGILARHFW